MSLPKGGGAIKGIGEKFAANPATGAGAMSVPIAASPGRAGFGPQMSLTYDSGAGNGPFGLGWSLNLPKIARKTDKGLPQYDDATESDVFILSDAEDLTPVLVEQDGQWVREQLQPRTVGGVQYRVERYRPRIEGLFARIERWTNTNQPTDVFWRSISRENVTTWYGRTAESRITDPDDASRIFSWLICASHDDKGNLISYGYKAENVENVDTDRASEQNRERRAGRYLKRIRYGNHTPYLPTLDPTASWPEPPTDDQWYFELVFDYGEHDAASPLPQDSPGWGPRPDAFSTHRSGFEVRTHRLCRRVLMFHHFPDEQEVGTDCLVRSTDLTYSHEETPADPRNPIYSKLTAVTQRGYQRQDAGYRVRSLPPLEFGYTEAVVQDTLRELPSDSAENMPIGLDGARYQWVDLDGEGLSGVLTEQGGAWLYKRNLSPLSQTEKNGRLEGRFGAVEVVTPVPALSLADGAQFLDLAGDGRPDVVRFTAQDSGFHRRAEGEGWEPFVAFRALPNRDWSDPNLRFVDLDGDGHADVLITEHDALVWHPSLAEEGFGPGRRMGKAWDEERGPALVFTDGEESIHLADMTGDGLTDLVRIRNGEVCYWPSLGYGRFGPKVTMDEAPFDRPDQFDQRRVLLADIDGSGTTDIIYLQAEGVRIYCNQSGNGWGPPVTLATLPPANYATSVKPVDLLGNGTACLVWSSPLPADAHRPLRYVDLMGGQKPHLLVKTANNLGAETEIQYAPSTRFYLQDRLAGTAWATKLPFPVHVVERVTVRDKWRGTSFSTTYSYHHGYFDGHEREFRGFGRVEQVDVEDYGTFAAANSSSPYVSMDQPLYQPPVKTVTWYHTGAPNERTMHQLASEYFPNGCAIRGEFQEYLPPDPEVEPQVLDPNERLEALRACKGLPMRQEIYELDAKGLAEGRHQPVRIFSSTSYACSIRRLQPRGGNRHAVFHVIDAETINYHYDLDLRTPTGPDPRIAHTLNLKVDDVGSVLQEVTVGYPRQTGVEPADPLLPHEATALMSALQGELHLSYVERRVTGDLRPSEVDSHRLRLPCEVRTYELTGVAPEGAYFTLGRLRGFRLSEHYQSAGTPVAELAYHELPNRTQPQKRLVEHLRTLFFDQALTGPLPFGAFAARAMVYETYALATTTQLLDCVFREKLTSDVMATMNASGKSGYLSGADLATRLGGDTAGQYWHRSGVAGFAANAAEHFCLPHFYTDPFGNTVVIDHDPRDLFACATTDPAGNRGEVLAYDFRVMAPRRVRDMNGNYSEVHFDVLGMPAAYALSGKEGEGDDFTGVDDAALNPDPAKLAAFFVTDDYNADRARQFLGGATTRHLAYLGETVQNGKVVWGQHPPCAATIARERHAGVSPVQTSFEYADGSGTALLRKIQAEPETPDGPLRWVTSGKTILNNKGKPVKRYEAYFSPPDVGHRFEEPQPIGVTSVAYYDAIGRQFRSDSPDGSYSRVEFSPWRHTSFDSNDTVLEPDNPWYARMSASADPAERQAAQRAQAHGGTPAVSVLDSLGRTVMTIGHNRLNGAEQKHVTVRRLDAEGKPLWVQDARGIRVAQYITPPLAAGAHPLDDAPNLNPQGFSPCYDVSGQLLYQHGSDSGDRWILPDAAGEPLYTWNGRGFRTRFTYDVLHRSIGLFVSAAGDTTLSGAPRKPGPADAEVLTELRTYGEAYADHNAEANLRGRPYRVYDGAGTVTNAGYDFKGNLLAVERRYASEYKSTPDWSALGGLADPEQIATAAEGLLEPGSPLRTETQYDAMNRATTVTTPDSSVFRAEFTPAGLIDRVDVHLNGAAEATPFVTGVAYNARGQRVSIDYGSGARTTYEYDPFTFRLTVARTTRPCTADATGSMLFQNPTVVQDLRYTYDPVGNITRMEDAALATTVHAGAVSEYVYDALYRLIAASGREHSGQTALQYSPGDTSRRDYPFTGARAHANDLQGLHNYVERYGYDAAGNLMSATHHGGASVDLPGQVRWQRRHQYALSDNRLLATSLPGEPDNLPEYAAPGGYGAKYTYDSHGNITAMPHVPLMRWNYKDQLSATAQQVVNDGMPETTYYLYDAAGTRVRKVTETSTGTRKNERMYLGGYEISREYTGQAVSVDRRTLHVQDGKQRIAIVQTLVSSAGAPAIRYQIGDHLASAGVELDQAGAVIGYESFHPYGTTAFQAGRSAAEVSLKRYRYTGKERDDETGFAYHGARYYLPWLGRWSGCDPIGIDGGLNVYAYVAGRPTIAADPNGHIFWFFVAAVVVIATLTAVSQAGAPTNERDAAAVKPHISEEEFAAHTAVTGVSMAAGGAAGEAMGGAPAVLKGAVGGGTGGALQSAGEQAIQDVKKGELSSGDQYATVTMQGAASGVVVGAAVAGAGQVVRKGAAFIKPGESGEAPPSDPYDVDAWNKYYERHPNANRSVGAAGADDAAAFGKGGKAAGEAEGGKSEGKPEAAAESKTGNAGSAVGQQGPNVTKLPFVPPKGKQVTAQPTGKTPQTNHNASALADRGRRIANAYPRDPLHHVLPQEFRKFFKARGIDVDDYVVKITEGEHSAIHSMKWNPKWKAWIDQNPNATVEEVWAFARKMMDEFKLNNRPFTRYTKSTR
ncbi:SpvB/TcaC N-terminal domain-containing protein [Streptomyces sp. NPDC005908]|uniref:SpvB/TcaC N-terminal domain-containing protein n=1 Tax=Streptomyces sp. NPDC005908 TaxID=3157084 RepID=UPI0033D6B2E7